MLPPGHIAAGFLTAEALLKITRPDLTVAQTNQLLWWGLFFGFAPDLDNFAAFAKVHSWWYKPGVDGGIHRKFLSHVPVLWLLAGLAVYVFGPGVYWKDVGLLMWLGSWSHFVLDSVEYGVMWLWPFNKRLWALKQPGVREDIEAKSFFDYWLKFLKIYLRCWTFYCEAGIIIIFLIVVFH